MCWRCNHFLHSFVHHIYFPAARKDRHALYLISYFEVEKLRNIDKLLTSYDIHVMAPARIRWPKFYLINISCTLPLYDTMYFLTKSMHVETRKVIVTINNIIQINQQNYWTLEFTILNVQNWSKWKWLNVINQSINLSIIVIITLILWFIVASKQRKERSIAKSPHQNVFLCKHVTINTHLNIWICQKDV